MLVLLMKETKENQYTLWQ